MKWAIYQDSVKNRQYYQLTSGTLESEVGELGSYQGLRDELNSF